MNNSIGMKKDAPYDKDVAEYQQKRYREKLQEQDFNDPGESKESAMKKKFSKFGKKEESWKSDEDAIWEKFNKGEITEEERNKYLSESSKIAKKGYHI